MVRVLFKVFKDAVKHSMVHKRTLHKKIVWLKIAIALSWRNPGIGFMEEVIFNLFFLSFILIFVQYLFSAYYFPVPVLSWRI